MKKILSLAITYTLFTFYNTNAQQKQVVNSSTKPKLVVGIVVDQMRYDYLFRYNKNYGSGGFNRLLKEGFNCASTNLSYMPSVTACGHAGIYTGSVPALHGIPSNDWYNKATHKMMYCTEDSTANTVGSVGKSGKMSPKNMWANTITDELRLNTNFRSKVIGISLKDRGSILPAGHSANAAYWMDDSLGNFITSTYYMQQLPAWAQSFNNQKKAEQYLNKDWNLLLPQSSYYQSTSDSNAYEGLYKGETASKFPHKTSAFVKKADIKRTPYGNDISLDFAKAAIEGEALGQGMETDFLALSLSSTDYVGHQFGINAVEIEDMYYRLDKSLADFLNFLDAKVGKGNYTIFLTADHGAAHNPKYLQDQKIPAGYFSGSAFKKSINEKAIAQFGKPVIADIGDNMIWLHDSVSSTKSLPFVLEEINAVKEVQFAIYYSALNTYVLPEELKKLVANGYNAQRSGDILFVLKPGHIEAYGTSQTGTTHGTWNPYDTHIPLVWFGNGIKKGQSYQNYQMCDIAPTLAALLQIQAPNASIGKVISEVLK
jgi:predicted AlkP superfamily pyrophosphatase or phosphodiesterase